MRQSLVEATCTRRTSKLIPLNLGASEELAILQKKDHLNPAWDAVFDTLTRIGWTICIDVDGHAQLKFKTSLGIWRALHSNQDSASIEASEIEEAEKERLVRQLRQLVALPEEEEE